MDLYGQEQYEELDWITQAEAPMEFKTNDLLMHFKDKLKMDDEVIARSVIDSYWNEFTVGDALRSIVNSSSDIDSLAYSKYARYINSCFELEFEGDLSIDLENKKILNGEIFLIKNRNFFEEKELLLHIKYECDRIFQGLDFDSAGRVNDILDLLGETEGRKTRSVRKKVRFLTNAFKKIVEENQWNVRNGDILISASTWIVNYIKHNNSADYANFCKLKVMTHGDVPIYKMEEVD